MKIATTDQDGQIFQHFGKTKHFRIYEVENAQVTHAQTVSTGESGHSALADLLKQLGVDTLICGGIGDCAKSALADAGIRLYPGVCGDADTAVQALLSGTLNYNPDIACAHHEHAQGTHSCGHHHEH